MKDARATTVESYPDLRSFHASEEELSLPERANGFEGFLREREGTDRYARCVGSAADREVSVRDLRSGAWRRMLMFGSNNYLGLANHPHVKERTIEAVRRYGIGVGGPPLLNGTTRLHEELEERLGALKCAEAAMLFSSGYAANVGLVTGLVRPRDLVLYDASSHASLWDGIRMAHVRALPFRHNDLRRLERLLSDRGGKVGLDVFVCVEGVYSMEGDLAPLDRLVPLCRAHGAMLVLDDAHGTGVLGAGGRGTAERFGVEGEVPLTMATFSKVFGASGGFVAGSRSLVEYLRFHARSYVFSAALPPPTVAAVLAGLDVIEREPWRLAALRRNVAYAAEMLQERFRAMGFDTSGLPVRPEAGIIPLRVPARMDVRWAGRRFHDLGIFVNAVEYPAVPVSQERFRVSLMATHRKGDIDRLVAAVEEVWGEHRRKGESPWTDPSS